VLPISLWERLAVEIEVEAAPLIGINDRPECQIPASLGQIRCVLTDETGQVSPELWILCFLAQTDRVPIILGFADLLSRFEVCFNYNTGEAFAEANA